MFEKILIANRGEIACRVMATARRMGIRTVAVYSDADADSRHLAMADEAVHIGPPAARESYLVADRVIDAAVKTGAQAIHPGYGFLAENAEFAEACAKAGVTFIGPPPDAIRAMGLKDAAKKIMENADVPVVPGYHGDAQDTDLLIAEAEKIGYPVLIKAVAGGGGKGMRRVDSADAFEAELAGAQREAKAAFGDDRVLLEKYLVKPRHIEIQVFADGHGNAVHLFERDCSVQRRHQKVLEEAPGPDVSAEMRTAMGDAAVAAAKAIDYQGAGTVEFIVDVSNGLDGAPFYFMEMNTRLQVEHPVTELITGQDLVDWQLQVAAGGALPCGQDDLTITGHAIEARVYAEDAARGFLPSTGKLQRLRAPAEGPHVRIDTGVREGDTVTPFYDPMIAKLVVWDHDRASALRRMSSALAQYQVVGPTTNIAFLRRVAEHPAFMNGDVETGFIDRYGDDLVPESVPASDDILAVACLSVLLDQTAERQVQAAQSNDPYSPWHRSDGWRLNDQGHQVVHLKDDEQAIDITVHYAADAYVVDLPDGSVTMRGEREADGTLTIDLGGRRSSAAVVQNGNELTVITHGHSHRLVLFDPLEAFGDDEAAGGAIASPLPGKIIQVLVAEDDEVAKGDPLIILEAMKMEHTVSAPGDGKVTQISVAAGDQVEEGNEIIVLELAGD